MKHFTLLAASLLMLAPLAKAQETMHTRATITDYPFVLTTDTVSPILYYIYNGRNSNNGESPTYVFANEVPWGDSVNRLQIVRQDPRIPKNQLWYFMAVDGGLTICSAADHRMVAVANTNDAPKCSVMLTADELTTESYIWQLDYTNNCYAFKTSDGKSFLSHNGNWQTAGPTMGLYNADGSKDEGSRVFFEPLNPESTGIASRPATEQPHVIYTITGQRIDAITAPGIYIINGKKVISKR